MHHTLTALEHRLLNDILGDEEYVELTRQLDEMLPEQAHYRPSGGMPDIEPPY